MRVIHVVILGLAVRSVFAAPAPETQSPQPSPAQTPGTIYVPFTPGQPLRMGGKTTVVENAGGTGPGVNASGEKAASVKVDNIKQPEAHLPGAGAMGGGGNVSADAEGLLKSPWTRVFLGVFCGLVIVGAWAAERFIPTWKIRQSINLTILGIFGLVVVAVWDYLGVLFAIGFVAAVLLQIVDGGLVAKLIATVEDKAKKADAAIESMGRRMEAIRSNPEHGKQIQDLMAKAADTKAVAAIPLTPEAEAALRKLKVT